MNTYNQTYHIIESHKYITTIVFDKDLYVTEIINPHKQLLLFTDSQKYMGINLNDFMDICCPDDEEKVENIIDEVSKLTVNDKPCYFEYSINRDNNDPIIVLCYCFKRKDGQIYCNVLPMDSKMLLHGRKNINIDISSQALDFLPAAVWIRDYSRHGRPEYIFFNSTAKKYFACEDITKSIYWNQNSADLLDQEALNTDGVVIKEYPLIDQDGNVRMWIELHKHRTENPAGGYIILTAAVDVSRYKNAKIEIKKQYSIIQAMYKALPFGLIGFDLKGRIHSINDQVLKIFGISDYEMSAGYSFFDDPNFYPEIIERIKSGEDVEYALDYDFKKARGVWSNIQKYGKKYIKFHISSIKDSKEDDKVIGYIMVCEDLTNEKKREKALKEAEVRVKGLFNSVKTGIIIYSNDLRILDCNDEALSLLGISDKNKTKSDKARLDQDPNFDLEIVDIIRKGIETVLYLNYDFDKLIEHGLLWSKNRGKSMFEVRSSKLATADNEELGTIVLFNDVTKKLEREQEVKELNTAFSSLMNVGKNIIWRYNIEDNKYESIVGTIYGPKDCSLQDALNIIHENDREAYKEAFRKLISGEAQSVKDYYRFINPDEDDYIVLLIEMTILIDSRTGKRYIFATQKNVTDEVNRQKELEQFQSRTKLINELNHIVQWDYNIKSEYITTTGVLANSTRKKFTLNEYLETVHPEDRERVIGIFNNLSDKNRHEFSIKIRSYVFGETGYRYVQLSCLPLYNRNGEIESYTGIRQDINEMMIYKQQLDEFQKRIELASNAADILQWEYDMRTHHVHILAGKTAIPGGNISVKEYINYIHPDDRRAVIERIMRMSDGELPDDECQIEFRLKLPEVNEYRTQVLNGVKIHDQEGKCIKYIGFRRDVTAWARQNAELQAAKLKAEESDHLKSAFLANMSHEIRTPLNAIVGFSDLIANTEDRGEKNEFKNIILNNSNILLSIIGDILDLSKIEAGTLDIINKKFDMSECYESVFKSIELKIANPNLRLTGDNPYKHCMVVLDSSRVQQVFTNFLTNAVKYTPDGEVFMTYNVVDGGVKIIVRDTGIGIAKEKFNKVFKRFEKLDSFAQGNGLGLAICHSITDRCGGKIGFDSELGKGSTFWAWFPTEAVIEE